jgi:hypothetical protein
MVILAFVVSIIGVAALGVLLQIPTQIVGLVILVVFSATGYFYFKS